MSTPASDVLTPERLADLRRIATGNPRRPDGQIREVQRIRMQWFARHGYIEIRPAPLASSPAERRACVTVTPLGLQVIAADDARKQAAE